MPRPTFRPGQLKQARVVGKLDGAFAEIALEVKTSFGRSPDCDVQLQDREVSKLHFSIQRVGSSFLLSDAGSSNGTFVNGHKVREVRLRDGDEIAAGNSRLIFYSGPSEEQNAKVFEAPVRNGTVDGKYVPLLALNDLQHTSERVGRLANALGEFAARLASETSIDRARTGLVRAAQQTLDADVVTLLLRADDNSLATVAWSRRDGVDAAPVLPTRLKRWAHNNLSALVSNDYPSDSQLGVPDSADDGEVRSVLLVPVVVALSFRGMLVCDTRGRGAHFEAEDLSFALSLVDVALIKLGLA